MTTDGDRPPATAAGARIIGQALGSLGAEGVTLERMPMLEVALDRLQRCLATSLRGLFAQDTEVGLGGVSGQRYGEHLSSLPPRAIVAVFRAMECEGCGLLTIDGGLSSAVVDRLLGSRPRARPGPAEARPFTPIEVTLIERLARLVLAELGHAFAAVAAIEFRLERMEINPRLAAIARSRDACLSVDLRIDLDGSGGSIGVLLPLATLEPVRPALLEAFMGERLGKDPIWQRHLGRELWQTDVELEAVLEERATTLADVMQLTVGSVLKLDLLPDSPVLLRCGRVAMLRGRVGRRGDGIVVHIDEAAQEQGETFA